MILSSETLPRNATVDADVCIVGCGAAGITLALELLETPLKVCILESGDRHPLADEDPFIRVTTTGLPLKETVRVRGLGGTTWKWQGKWKRHDPIDFEEKEWVPDSGWPVSFEELLPYYRRAEARLLMPDAEETAGSPAGPVQDMHLLLQDRALWNWGRTFGPQMEAAPRLTVYLQSHLLSLAKEGSRVVSAACRSTDGNDFTVRAKRYVLATGGIENARLLLLSEIGNSHDQVGRRYMDHPKAKVGVIETYRPQDFSDYREVAVPGGTKHRGLRLTDRMQRENQTLNSSVLLEPLSPSSLFGPLTRRFVSASAVVAIRNYMEQAPDPENRVRLGSDKDPFGRPLPVLDWKLSDLDCRTMTVFHETLRHEFRRAEIGELRSPLLLSPGDSFPITGDASHPMGTTRMGADPLSSVVDRDCRVHDCENLFVAGSSVFPTGGYSNPMATLAALAVRLSDLLKTA